MSQQSDGLVERSEQLRRLGLQCASIITKDSDSWKETAKWLKNLPLCWTIGSTNDPNNPALHDGRWSIVDPVLSAYVFDNESEADRIWGPICRQLFNGWDAAVYRFRKRDCDNFYDFGTDDAKRIMLLGALTLNRDFDGAELGLGWPWKHPESCGSLFEGRDWAWSKITSGVCAEDSLLELIERAIDYLEVLPSMRQGSHEDHETKATGGSTAIDDGAKADAEVQLAINAEQRGTGELVKQRAPREDWRKEILMDEAEERLSVEKAAGCIQMSERTIYRMMDDGLPYMQPRDKPKSHRRIRKSDVLAWRAGSHPALQKIK